MCYGVDSIDDVRHLLVATRGMSGSTDQAGLLVRAGKKLHGLLQPALSAIAIHDGHNAMVVSSGEGLAGDLVGARVLRGPGLGWQALAGTSACVLSRSPHAVIDDAVVDAAASRGAGTLAAVRIELGAHPLGVLYAGVKGRRMPRRTTLLMSEFAASLAPLVVAVAQAAAADRRAVEEERQRIAQQLHDTAGQLLFRIALSAQELQDQTLESRERIHRARMIRADAAEAATCLRAAMHRMLPTRDALPVTIRRDAAMFGARTRTSIEVITLGEPSQAPTEIESVLISALREALHNVEKHAKASAVLVSIAYTQTEIVLEVDDDGRGLPPDFVPHPVLGRSPGLGVPGLIQQAQGVGGRLTLEHNDDGGTRLRAALPWTHSDG